MLSPRNNKHLQSCLALFLAIALVASCALDDGDPWGRAHFELNADFDPSERLEADRIKTAQNYAVELDRLEVGFSTLSLELADASTGPTRFDPSDPPQGYSLCHNGHCHHDSGALVDYEDIEAELAGSEATAGGVLQAIDRSIAIDGRTPIALGDCSNNCHLDQGRLSILRLELVSIRLSGRAFDTSTQQRLDDGGERFDFTVPVDADLVETLDGPVGRDEPVDVFITGELDISVKLLDSINFGALSSDSSSIDSATAEAIEASLTGDSTFEISISRDN